MDKYLTLHIRPDGRKWCGSDITAKDFSNAQEQAEVVEKEAMQRYVSQLSPAGQQYWQQYLEETKTTKRADVIESLQETFNQVSDSDRKLITQVQSAMGI